jgi:DHA1 family multidrug resistance protein-like MFS transporter
MKPGVSGLPYLALVVGGLTAGVVAILFQPGYKKKLIKNNNFPTPEWRLPSMILGGFCFALGLFWFGWTGYNRHIHWIALTLSGLLTGFRLLLLLLQAFNYILDTCAQTDFSASAIAANTFLRSIIGAGFPLFAVQMFDYMHVQWACTLLGCLVLAFLALPIVLNPCMLRFESGNGI